MVALAVPLARLALIVTNRRPTNRRACRTGSSPMPSKGWSTRFEEPIVLDDGTKLTTLRDAIQYLARTVPKAEQNDEKVLTAADHLTRSAELGYPLFFARAATLQAIDRNKERVFNPDRKDHHWGKRKLYLERACLCSKRPDPDDFLPKRLDQRRCRILQLSTRISISSEHMAVAHSDAGHFDDFLFRKCLEQTFGLR
jgi:hypothetical protein